MIVAFINVNAVATGGAEESLALLLLNLGDDITPVLVSFEDGPFADTIRQSGIRVVIHPIPRTIMKARRDGSWLAGIPSVPFEAFRLARMLHGLSPDVIHTDTMRGHLLASLAGRLIGVPTILHIRDILEGNARLLLKFLIRYFAADYIPVSKSVARWYGLQVSKVIYNPLDMGRYLGRRSKSEARAMLNLPQSMPIVGIVGRINRWKGHDRFLRSIAIALKSCDLHAVIVGEARNRDEDFVPELHELVSSLHLNHKVTFVPWLKDPALVYAALDVNVNCSTREPFGRSILEAAACGVPSVCFDDGAFAEIFEPCDVGFAVKSYDEEACAAAIVKLIVAGRHDGPIIRKLDRFSTDEHVNAVTLRISAIVRKKMLGISWYPPNGRLDARSRIP